MCERCHRRAGVLTGSYFNTQMICETCAGRERRHPEFEEARKAEEAAVRNGDFDFEGIGKPGDL